MRDPRPISEDAIHLAIADLLRFKAHPRTLWWHVPNQGKRTGWTGDKLKRMGMRPGAADFSLILPDGRGAQMEVKTATGVQSPAQLDFQADCEARGIPYAIVRSSAEAEAVLASWGALREEGRKAA